MRLQLQLIWDALRTSFWFVPALTTGAAILLAAVMLQIDQARQEGISFIGAQEAEGARTILSAVAGAIITVTGLVFSVTVLILTQATSKFGPRLLRDFMRDVGTQVTLGVFVGTFTYCLIVLWLVRGGDTPFVPDLSAFGGIALAFVSTGVLIYFIHHVSASIQVENLVARIGRELVDTAMRLYPQEGKSGSTDWDEAEPLPEVQHYAPRSGYLQSIDYDVLVSFASKHDLRLVVPMRPGEFVVEGDPIMGIRGRTGSGNLPREVETAFSVGSYRTATQDVEYSVVQLVEIALRGLSPGVNEPYTALVCVDWLGAGLRCLAEREFLPTRICDRQGIERVVAKRLTFREITLTALDPIRRFSGSHPMILRRMEHLIEDALRIATESHREVLIEELRRTQHACSTEGARQSM